MFSDKSLQQQLEA